MDPALLKELVLDQRDRLRDLPLGVEREGLADMARYARMDHAVVIAGLRRSGKSTFLRQILSRFFEDDAYYFSFEGERLLHFRVEHMNLLHETFLEIFGPKKTFFLDEVQNVPGWEAFVRRMQDAGYKFFLTGSNASLLSRELGTRLTGRTVWREMQPFSFREFLRFRGRPAAPGAWVRTALRARLRRDFGEYLRYGGMPEFLKDGDPAVLERLYEDILYRDIVARHGIQDVVALRELGLYLLSHPGGLFAHHRMKQVLRLGSENTVRAYLEHLEDAFLVFTIRRFSRSLKQQMANPRKVYLADNGIADAVAFRFSSNRGRFLENLVFLELRRRRHDLYYYRTARDQEVDFLARRGREIALLVQVAESLRDPEVRRRELDALFAAMEELKVSRGLVLTEDGEETVRRRRRTVRVVPIVRWLMEPAPSAP